MNWLNKLIWAMAYRGGDGEVFKGSVWLAWLMIAVALGGTLFHLYALLAYESAEGLLPTWVFAHSWIAVAVISLLFLVIRHFSLTAEELKRMTVPDKQRILCEVVYWAWLALLMVGLPILYSNIF